MQKKIRKGFDNYLTSYIIHTINIKTNKDK